MSRFNEQASITLPSEVRGSSLLTLTLSVDTGDGIGAESTLKQLPFTPLQ